MGSDWNCSRSVCDHADSLAVVPNANGLIWARRVIHEPVGMIVKNTAFLVFVWVCGAIPGGRM